MTFTSLTPLEERVASRGRGLTQNHDKKCHLGIQQKPLALPGHLHKHILDTFTFTENWLKTHWILLFQRYMTSETFFGPINLIEPLYIPFLINTKYLKVIVATFLSVLINIFSQNYEGNILHFHHEICVKICLLVKKVGSR